MPWKAKDAEAHVKGLSKDQQHAWAVIANSARKKCISSGKDGKACDAQAIRVANAMAKKAKHSDSGERVIRLYETPRQLHEIASGEIRSVKHDEATGVLTAEVIISREAVLPYQQADGSVVNEYIPADELRKPDFLASCQGKPVTDGHPTAQVVTMETLSHHSKGSLHGPVEVEDIDGVPSVIAHETIWDQGLIREILDGRKRQVSIGRWAVLTEDEGEWNGTAYTMRQSNLELNHLAHTDNGRQGDACRILLDEALMDAPSAEAALKELEGLLDRPVDELVDGIKAVVDRWVEKPAVLGDIGWWIANMKRQLQSAIKAAGQSEKVDGLKEALSNMNSEWPDLKVDDEEPEGTTSPSVPVQTGTGNGGEAEMENKVDQTYTIAGKELRIPWKALEALDESERQTFSDHLTEVLSGADQAVADATAALKGKDTEIDELRRKLADAEAGKEGVTDEYKALKERVDSHDQKLNDENASMRIAAEVEERTRLLEAIRMVDDEYDHTTVPTSVMKRDLLARYHGDMAEAAHEKGEDGEYTKNDSYVQARVDVIMDALRDRRGSSVGTALLRPVATTKADSKIEQMREARKNMYKGGDRA